jgi:pimeloyl-ACP methyl ester carboxylesterase
MKSNGGPSGPSAGDAPVESRVRVSNVELCCFEWGAARRDEGTVLLAHATGFHARCWDTVVAKLGSRHVIAVDQRGHGRSDNVQITDWSALASDLAELVEALDLQQVTGVGHSMGGHAMVGAAALAEARFERLVLIDPVISSPESYAEGGWALPDGNEVHPTAKRKNDFTSAAEMIGRFRERHPFSLFEPQALADYCTHGLVPAPDGDGLVLACPPRVEASVYMTSRTNPGIHEQARSLSIPVTILRAAPPEARAVMDFGVSPTWPDLVHEFQNGHDVLLAHLSHFIPMQDPGVVAEAILMGRVER